MEAPTPVHPSRPRTRDDNDPKVVQHRIYVLQYKLRMRAENPVAFLQAKRDYNARHKEERAAYNRMYKARKRAEKAAQELVRAN